jgi:hypothetical protein
VSASVPKENADSMSLAELATIGVLLSIMRGLTRSTREMLSSAARFQRNTFQSEGYSGEMSEGSAEARPRGGRNWRKKRRRSGEPDSRGPESRAYPGSRLESDGTEISATACRRSAAGSARSPIRAQVAEGRQAKHTNPKGRGRSSKSAALRNTTSCETQSNNGEGRQDPGEVEWVAQWTYGTVHRLAEKTKIGVEKWKGHSPDEIKESHIYVFKPPIRYLKTLFGDFIVKDRDFRIFAQPEGTWDREHPPL